MHLSKSDLLRSIHLDHDVPLVMLAQRSMHSSCLWPQLRLRRRSPSGKFRHTVLCDYPHLLASVHASPLVALCAANLYYNASPHASQEPSKRCAGGCRNPSSRDLLLAACSIACAGLPRAGRGDACPHPRVAVVAPSITASSRRGRMLNKRSDSYSFLQWMDGAKD